MRRRPLLTLTALASALALAACAPADEAASPSTSASSGTASADTCTKATLPTREDGVLTVGTDKPAYEPWFVDDDPTSGKGFESAVAYAVAAELGYSPSDVKWAVVSFTQATSPGPKTFDVDVNQVSITEVRKKTLDFSSGYYDVAQAVVTSKGSKAAGVTSIADLKGLRLGTQVGTTSYTAATEVIAPTEKVAVFNTNDDAKAALANGQVDAIVVDLPTALYLSAVPAADGGIDDGLLVGQLPASGTPEQFGMVLDKGSPLTACVSGAVDKLRADGTLGELEQTWLTDTAGAPVLS
ncbi:MAG TPA: ABC transporter substrate-binding protein [Actinomycetales bacterium]|jgi:polar amino acid transport system substrate-binding protein